VARILIVEDEPGYRTLLKQILASENHEVEAFGNPDAAIQASDTFRPEILITDWMLKDDWNGVQVAETLYNRNPNLLTILITGYASSKIRHQPGHDHIYQILEKPFGLEDLTKTVDTASGLLEIQP
jgi:DNA-binding NtrC family response regulator